MSEFNSIFNTSHCVSRSQLISYIRQQLDNEEAHVVESHINDCQFCNDALDALMENDTVQVEKDIREVRELLIKKMTPVLVPLSNKPGDGVKTDLPQLSLNRKRSTRWLAAASILLLVGLGGFSVFSYIKSQKKQLSLNEGKSGSTSDAAYSTTPGDAGEIVKINVAQNDTFEKYAHDEELPRTKAPGAPVAATETKTPSIKEFGSVNPVATATAADEKSVAKIQDEFKPAKPATVQEQPQNIDAESGMENFARGNLEEKTTNEMTTKAISKKKSAGGMKNDRGNNYKDNQFNGSRNNNDQVQNINQAQLQKYENNKLDKEVTISDFDQGMDLFNKQDYKKSISYFEKALKTAKGPEIEDVKYHLALAYQRSGKERKAQKMFSELESSPKYSDEAARELKTMKK